MVERRGSGEPATRRGERGPLDAFVGRDAELAALVRTLDGALGGQTALALVVGEAGIGKSRLVDALVVEARRRGVRVLRGDAVERQSAPLSLWAGVGRALGAGPDPLDSSLPPSEGRWLLLDGLAASLAEAAPALVVVEDLHWADEASLWVLERLPRELLGEPVMVVGTSRREEPGAAALDAVRRRAAVLELRGLDVTAVQELIDILGTGTPDAAGTVGRIDAAALVARTGGNPLFVRELLALGRQGDGLPPVVSAVLRRSLTRLPANVQDALAALALAGPKTPLAVLAAALGMTINDPLARFDEAAAADVVTVGPAGRPEFRHVLLAEAAADRLTPTRRRELHAALAEAWRILDTSPPGRAKAARHRLAALPDGDPAAAGTEALEAVRALRERGDEVGAAELAAAATQALEACAGGALVELRARIEVELAQALDALGEGMRAQDTFARAADLLRQVDDAEPELRAVAEVGACREANPLMPHPERVQRLAEVDAALAPGDHPLRVRLLGRMAVLRAASPGGLAAAHAEGDAAVAMARRLGDPDLLVAALADRHFIPFGIAGLEARAAAADELVALGERLRRPHIALQGYEWRFADRLDRGDRAGANAALEALEAYAQVMPSPRWRWLAIMRRAAIHQVDGDREGALASVEEVVVLGRELSRDEELLALDLAIRSTTALLWGAPDPGLRPVYQRMAAATAPAAHSPVIGLLLARGACAAGEPERARPAVTRWAADPEPLLQGLEGVYLVATLGSMAAELAMAEHAAALRRVLMPFRHRLGSGIGILVTPVATTLGRLALLEGDADAALTHHTEALALAEAMPSATLVAHCAAYLAQACAVAGDDAGAATALARAQAAAEPLGIALPHLGVAAEPARGTPPATDVGVARQPVTGSPPTADEGEVADVGEGARGDGSRGQRPERGPAQAPGQRPERGPGQRPERGSIRGVGQGRGRGRAELRRGDGGWRFESPHGAGTVPDSLGIAQLARLLAAVNREISATELAGMDASPVPVTRDLGAALDARAKREYRRRIGELQADIDEAGTDNDPERAARARVELDALVQELRRAVGLDGRDRPSGSGAERARVNVTRSLRRAIAAIAEQVPDLGAHLERSVRTGRYCSYSPEPSAALTWDIVD